MKIKPGTVYKSLLSKDDVYYVVTDVGSTMSNTIRVVNDGAKWTVKHNVGYNTSLLAGYSAVGEINVDNIIVDSVVNAVGNV